jgi:hypothetical protein
MKAVYMTKGLYDYQTIMFDEPVKSQKAGFPVIPAKAGLQFFPPVINTLDSGFHRSDDFLRNHHVP